MFCRDPFKGIRKGQRVEFTTYRMGKPEGTASAIVNPMLIFEDHVVVNYGGCGQVVDSKNFRRVIR